LQIFLAEHIKSCQGAWKEEKQVKYFPNFLAEHIFIAQGRSCDYICVL